jgi:RNA polymerase sigma-70 factor (ECF subfamily)
VTALIFAKRLHQKFLLATFADLFLCFVKGSESKMDMFPAASPANPTPTPDLVSEAYLSRAQTGDSEAFARLCELHRKRVWRVVASVTRGGADTEDLAQDAMVRAWAAFPTYRAEAPFEAWLCRIALNAAHDYQRSAWKRRVLLWDRSSSETPDFEALSGQVAPSAQGEAEKRELQQRVRQAVAKLKECERVPIWMIYFEQFSLAEVARLEGLPESTIRSRVKAGLKRLERQLGDFDLKRGTPAQYQDEACRQATTDKAQRLSLKGCSA